MLRIKKLERTDLPEFFPIEIQDQEFLTFVEMFHDFDGTDALDSYCFVDENNDVVLIIGTLRKWENVYDTFTVFSMYWKPVYFRQVKPHVKLYLKRNKYDRIEHMVNCSRPWTDKMAKFFGFEYVATIRKYLDGQDYKMYEVVK